VEIKYYKPVLEDVRINLDTGFRKICSKRSRAELLNIQVHDIIIDRSGVWMAAEMA
jgi:hypothetical protein